MSKIDLVDVASGYNLSQINANFQKIEDELNDRVIYRDAPAGEPNEWLKYQDANAQRLLNLPDATSAGEPITFRQFTNGVVIPGAPVPHGEIDLADYVTTPSSASAEINIAAAVARSSGQALVSYDTSVEYVLTAGVPIDLMGLKYIDIKSKIDTTNLDTVTTTGCILLGDLSLSVGGSWKFGDIISSNPVGANTATAYPQMRIQGAKGIRMEFENIRYRQWYMDYTGGSGAYTRSGNAYNNIYDAGRVGLEEVDSITRITDPLWFNENTFWGGRHYKIILRDNGYTHNHNVWKRPLFEDDETEIRLETGSSNYFEGCRFEGLPSVESITSITQASPAVVTVGSHTYVDGDDVYIYNVAGMVELTEGYYEIANVTPTTFELVGIDSTAYTTYTGSGLVKKPTVYFGVNTYVNDVSRTWVSSLNPREIIQDPFNATAVRNLGFGNEWSYDKNEQRKRIEMFNFTGDQSVLCTGTTSPVDSAGSANTFLFSAPRDQRSTSGSRGFYPSVINSFFPNAFSPIAETPMIPVKKGDVFSFYTKTSSGGVRFTAFCYDENGSPLVVPAANQVANLPANDPDLWFSSSQMTTYAADGQFGIGSDITGLGSNASRETMPSASCSIANDAIKFVRFRCTTGNNSNTLLEYCSGYYHEPSQGNPPARAKLEKEFGEIILTGKPVMGLAPLGTKVQTADGEWECDFTLFTTLNGAVANGATSATVTEAVGDSPFNAALTDGKIYGILLTDGTMAWGTVAGLAGNTFNITALTSPAGTSGASAVDGALVYFAEWNQVLRVTGEPNLGVGTNMLANLGIASQNVVVGVERTAESLDQGSSNTLIGSDVAILLEDGGENTLIGRRAGRYITPLVNRNTLIGFDAGPVIESDKNTVVGSGSATLVTLGAIHTVVGSDNLKDVTTGTNCTAIGTLCDAGSATAAHRIMLGNNVDGTADNQFSFGKSGSVVSNDFGTDALWSRLSDKRLKNIIKDNELGLDFISGIETVVFTMKSDKSEMPIYGITAQNLKSQLDKVGCTDFNGWYEEDDDSKTQKVKHEALMFPMIKAIQELEARVKELEDK